VAHYLHEIMTKQIFSVRKDANVRAVARVMRERKIGDVLVTNRDGTLFGIVTDRDLVVRALSSSRDLDNMQVAEVATDALVQLPPTATIDEAVTLMRERAIRHIPVVRDDIAIGIVSLGDLARRQDPKSVLAQISAAPPNN
jgi:CBS domain-containing protein